MVIGPWLVDEVLHLKRLIQLALLDLLTACKFGFEIDELLKESGLLCLPLAISLLVYSVELDLERLHLLLLLVLQVRQLSEDLLLPLRHKLLVFFLLESKDIYLHFLGLRVAIDS